MNAEDKKFYDVARSHLAEDKSIVDAAHAVIAAGCEQDRALDIAMEIYCG